MTEVITLDSAQFYQRITKFYKTWQEVNFDETPHFLSFGKKSIF